MMSTKRDKRLDGPSTNSHRRKPKPYCDLRPASQLLLHSTTTTTSILSQASRIRRASRTSSTFKVFCDTDLPPEPHTRPSPVTRPLTVRRTLNSTMLCDKENTVPEFEDIILPSKRSTLARPKLTDPSLMLAEKKPVPGSVDCRDELWGGKAPFSACSPTEQASQPIPQDKSRGSLQTSVPTRGLGLEASVYRRAHVEEKQVDEEEQRDEQMKEVTSLVAQLEVIETDERVKQEEDDEDSMQDPLPIDAVCPGAPKPGDTFTLPKFEYGDDDEYGSEAVGVVLVGSKSPSRSFQMSPLAEVTEAYTGLQGGWSPPLESWSPVLSDQVSNMLPLVSQEMEEDEEESTKEGSIFKLDNLAPRLKRRREVLLGIEAASKGPMRI